MKYSFQHFVDISTSAESMQILNFNVGGEDVIRRCAHLFNAYKYFKLGKVSIKFVPASTLPVDPLGMSYNDEDPQTVDPRDQLNPGLVRITNGEDLLTDLTNVGVDTQDKIYQAMMLDPHWYKFNLQSGFKRSAVPLYWQIGQLHQDQYPGSTVNVLGRYTDESIPAVTTTDTGVYELTMNASGTDGWSTVRTHVNTHDSSPRGLFQVGHRGRLGYLPTDSYQHYWGSESHSGDVNLPMVHPAPCIQVITAVLPRALKTLYYYRVYITETVYFSGLRSIAPFDETSGLTYRGIDNFIQPPNITAAAPYTGTSVTMLPTIPNLNDGQNREGEL